MWKDQNISTELAPLQACLPGTIVINGKTFHGCNLMYDICNDDLLTKAGQNIIIKLNKEMVESFTFNYLFKSYRFIKLEKDSLNDLNGYVNLFYKGNFTASLIIHLSWIITLNCL